MTIYSSGSGRLRDFDNEGISVSDVGFWECSYCGSSNLNSTTKCNGCGATRKKQERRSNGYPVITYGDFEERNTLEVPKKKGRFGRLFGR